jgi:uncharacterized RDD family membrane protein YckC
MQRYKKVSGERVVAALVDYIAMYVVGLIISIVPLFFFGFEDFIDSIFGAAIMGTGDTMSPEFIMYTMITVYAGLVVYLIYFVIVPWKWNGQTLGKKLMKLRAINEYGENPGLWSHFVRSIQGWTTYYTALVGWVILINYLLFSVLSIVTFLISAVFLVSFIMMLAREDGRGLHDMMAGTWVIKTDENLDQQFAETTAQMGDWVEVEDRDDDWDKAPKEKEDDDWEF